MSSTYGRSTWSSRRRVIGLVVGAIIALFLVHPASASGRIVNTHKAQTSAERYSGLCEQQNSAAWHTYWHQYFNGVQYVDGKPVIAANLSPLCRHRADLLATKSDTC